MRAGSRLPLKAEPFLREHPPIPCRHFATTDGAVRWFRDADPAPPKP